MSTTLKRAVRSVLPRPAVRRLGQLVNRLQGLRTYRFTFPAARRQPQTRELPPLVAGDNLLEQLGAKYLPSKRNHNYLPLYWMHLRDIRLQVRSVLEIGVQTDHSIRMWEEFFPNATIYGLDIDPRCLAFAGGRRRILIGDQGDVAFLRSVVAQTGPLDVIIDDGSHIVEHQLKTFDLLFPFLSSHGVYVIEDVGGVVGDYSLRTVGALKGLVDKIMHWPAGVEPEEWPRLAAFPEGTPWAERNVVGVAFYRWIVFVMRGKNPEDNPFLHRS